MLKHLLTVNSVAVPEHLASWFRQVFPARPGCLLQSAGWRPEQYRMYSI